MPEAAHPDANIIFGAVIDDALGDEVRVTVIAAGFDGGLPPARKSAVSTTVTKRAGRRHPGRRRDRAVAVRRRYGSAGDPCHAGAAGAAREPRRIVFDDAADDDELDVPDFLK